MSGIRDTATVTLNVNGAQAKQFMADLEKQIQDTEAAIVDMQKKMADPKDIEKAKKQLKTYKKQLDEMRSATEGVNRALENIKLATPRELEKALRTLNRQLKDMVPGSEVWNSHIEKIRNLKARLSDLKDEMGKQQSLWERFNDWATKVWPSIDLLSRGYDALVSGMRNYVDAYADMEQEMANVRKFTGMTEEQVASLNEEFKKIDTRSSREQLNLLAQEAGRLGKTSEEDVLGFVRAADKINVALDDLGEGATLTLSKLTGIFGDEARYGTEQSLLKVGSVINELSQNCSASAPYLAEFASRMGGVGAQAGMTVQQIMGLAAVLDSNNQKLEASATAVAQVLTRLYQTPSKYAKVAGLDVKKFTDLLKKDANEALITLLDALNRAGGLDKLSPMFKDMGENGSRAIAALSTLANNIDEVRKQQEAANKAFDDGTSIDQEFAVQNNTVQAALEKCKNRAQELRVELGKRLYPIMGMFLSTGAAIMRILLTLTKFVGDNGIAIITLVTSIAMYNIAANAAAIKTALWSAAIKVATVAKVAYVAATQLVTAAIALCTGNINKAKAAFLAFSNTLKASPWGLVLAGITAVIGGMIAWISKLGEAIQEERRLAEERRKHFESLTDISERAAECADKEVGSLKRLYSAAIDESKSKKERLAAAQQILDKYPEYFAGVSAEMIMVGGATRQYNALTQAIINNAKARAAAEKILENEKKIIELELKLDKAGESLSAAEINYMNIRQKPEEYVFSVKGGGYFKSGTKSVELSKAEKIKDQLNSEYQSILGEIEELERANGYLRDKYGVTSDMLGKLSAETPAPNLNGIYTGNRSGGGSQKSGGSGKSADKKREEAAKKALKDDLKEQKKLYETAVSNEESRYNNQEITYAEYLERKYKLDLDYIDEQKKVLIKHRMEDTEEFARLCKEEEDIKRNSLENIKKHKFKDLEDTHKKESVENRNAYYSGEIDYQEYLDKQELLALKLVADKMKILSDANMQESSDFVDLIQEKESLLEKHLERVQNMSIMALNNQHSQALSDIELQFNDPNSAIFGNEKAKHQASLIENYRYLTAMRDMYLRGSDEWVKYQKQIDELLEEDKLRKQKEIGEAILVYSAEYRQRDRAQREADEIAILNEIREKGLISEEEYRRGLAAIRKKFANEAKDTEKDSWDETRSEVSEFKSTLTGQIFDMAAALDRLFDKSRGEDFWQNLSSAAEASFAVMNSLVSQFNSYFSAEKDLEIAKVTKSYDEQIKAAGNNNKKSQKLEEEKQKAIARLKSSYNNRAMKIEIAMAAAETAKNAIAAYGAGLKFPFPANTVMPMILAGLAVAQGAMQMAVIKKQHDTEAMGYSSGGFTRPGRVDEPAGIVHAGEWVASQRLLASPVARPMIEALDYAQRNNSIGSLRAEDVSRSITAPASLVKASESNEGLLALLAAASRMSGAVDNLTDRLNEPFVTVNTVTGDKGIKSAQDEYKRLIANKTPKSKKHAINY